VNRVRQESEEQLQKKLDNALKSNEIGLWELQVLNGRLDDHLVEFSKQQPKFCNFKLTLPRWQGYT